MKRKMGLILLHQKEVIAFGTTAIQTRQISRNKMDLPDGYSFKLDFLLL